MNVLFFGDQWDDMWRRRQQLAWRLAQTGPVERVVYIERPLTTTSLLKSLAGRGDREATDRWRRVLSNRSWVMPVGEKLTVLATFAPLPSVGPAWLFRASERVRDRWLLRYLKAHFGLDRAFVWVSHPLLSKEFIQALRPGMLWYDCTEDFAAVPGLKECVRAQIRATDCWLTAHADVITAVSSTLYEEKRRNNGNTHWLPNAVDADLFLQPQESFPVPADLQHAPRPILAFVGGLNDWAHDWDLLDRVATLRPAWTILLIGELTLGPEIWRMLQSHANILCVGQKPYRELPAYLAHSDICFQFYRRARGNDTRNSQKLFLYFAAGKPVVSTPSADVEVYARHVYLADTPGIFVSRVENALAESALDALDERQHLACVNSWKARIDQILQLLEHRMRTSRPPR